MNKLVLKLLIIALILVMALSFAGCGGGGSSGGGGGGNGGDVDPLAGYWYVQKMVNQTGSIEFPYPMVRNGIPCDMEAIFGFVGKKMYKYSRYSGVHPDTGEKVSQVYCESNEVKSYRIDGNKARYEGGTLTFYHNG